VLRSDPSLFSFYAPIKFCLGFTLFALALLKNKRFNRL